MSPVSNEVTPVYEPGARITAKTTADVIGKRLVAVSATPDSEGNIKVAHAAVNALTADGGLAIGVASHDAASGSLVTVIGGPGTCVHIDPSADVTAGAKLAQAASGKVAPAADTDTVIGIALSTADESDGDDVLVKLLV